MLPTHDISAGEKVHSSVIWMHGLGATNHDFDDLVPELGLDGVRYVFPQAPNRRVTINGGFEMPAWYDILSLDDPPLREREADVRETERELSLLIDRERARGIPSQRIFLAGFSQGGAVALHAALRYPEPLAGALILSAYLLLPQAFESECHLGNRHLRMLFCHGQSDAVVPMALGRRAFERATNAGYRAEWHTFPMAHSICLEEIQVIRDWLKLRLAEPLTEP